MRPTGVRSSANYGTKRKKPGTLSHKRAGLGLLGVSLTDPDAA